MRPLQRAVRVSAVVIAMLACTKSNERSGDLAPLADSLLPRNAAADCSNLDDVAAQGGSRDQACQARVGDTLVTVVTTPESHEVVRVTQRWRPVGDLVAAREQVERSYAAKLGQGDRICSGSTFDPGRRWQRDGRVVTLASYPADSTLEVSFTGQPPQFGQPCPE